MTFVGSFYVKFSGRSFERFVSAIHDGRDWTPSETKSRRICTVSWAFKSVFSDFSTVAGLAQYTINQYTIYPFDEWPTCRGPQKRLVVVRSHVLRHHSSIRFKRFQSSSMDVYNAPCTTDPSPTRCRRIHKRRNKPSPSTRSSRTTRCYAEVYDRNPVDGLNPFFFTPDRNGNVAATGSRRRRSSRTLDEQFRIL